MCGRLIHKFQACSQCSCIVMRSNVTNNKLPIAPSEKPNTIRLPNWPPYTKTETIYPNEMSMFIEHFLRCVLCCGDVLNRRKITSSSEPTKRRSCNNDHDDIELSAPANDVLSRVDLCLVFSRRVFRVIPNWFAVCCVRQLHIARGSTDRIVWFGIQSHIKSICVTPFRVPFMWLPCVRFANCVVIRLFEWRSCSWRTWYALEMSCCCGIPFELIPPGCGLTYECCVAFGTYYANNVPHPKFRVRTLLMPNRCVELVAKTVAHNSHVTTVVRGIAQLFAQTHTKHILTRHQITARRTQHKPLATCWNWPPALLSTTTTAPLIKRVHNRER